MAAKFLNVYQFKITLDDTKPKIWRRIQVPENYNFEELHIAIQDAMGWENSHLHKFEMSIGKAAGVTIGTYECDKLEHKANIADYFVSPKDRAFYEYDFGVLSHLF